MNVLKKRNSFNSTLVRFKLLYGKKFRARLKGFQFHSGSIQTKAELKEFVREDRFNSTLVRFKPSENPMSLTVNFVSIPLWFDSNRKALREQLSTLTMFQFHSGSIQTRSTDGCSGEEAAVSIPLWFDSNSPVCASRNLPCMFQFHSGSIQTHLQRSLRCAKIGFNSTLVRFKPNMMIGMSKKIVGVSIPLWFDSNISQIVEGIMSAMFQFHSGSIQTRKCADAHDRSPWFQFHSGSIQTLFSSQQSVRDETVSIPLWFDSNAIK